MAILDEYPRPNLVRDSYLNLNGDWKCKIYNSDGSTKYKGDIVVPYSPETVASGVLQKVLPDDVLEYNKTITIDSNFNKGRLKLNFGAVDQICELYINGEYVGRHIGGYTPFSADITDYVKGDTFDVKLRVKDHTEKSGLQRGKQSSHPFGIFYPAQSGIWQTVWMESTPENYINEVKIKPDVENQGVRIRVSTNKKEPMKCSITIDGKTYEGIETYDVEKGEYRTIRFPLDNPIFWEPDNPHLYDVKIKLGDDEISTYFGYRSIDKKIVDGSLRWFLNGKPLFIRGVLDQGYYKEGLYTPDSYDTVKKDIEKAKYMGFNTIRKHIKVEPELFYYYCDKMGMLVNQDMVNGGGYYNLPVIAAPMVANIPISDKNSFLFSRTDEKAKKMDTTAFLRTISALYNHPSIIYWTIFNEGWGQFDTDKIYDLLMSQDSSRIIDSVSGWYHQDVGDVVDYHHYYTAVKLENKTKKVKDPETGELVDALLPIFLGEFGGVSVGDDKALYAKVKDDKELEKRIKMMLYRDVLLNLFNGVNLNGFVWTQLRDVEGEQNGLLDSDGNPKADLKGIFDIEKEVTMIRDLWKQKRTDEIAKIINSKKSDMYRFVSLLADMHESKKRINK